MKEERKKYERPFMKRNLVELEEGFCVASVDIQNRPKQAGIESHDVNENFEVDFSSGGSWDQ